MVESLDFLTTRPPSCQIKRRITRTEIDNLSNANYSKQICISHEADSRFTIDAPLIDYLRNGLSVPQFCLEKIICF